jgi:hypothetical protein
VLSIENKENEEKTLGAESRCLSSWFDFGVRFRCCQRRLLFWFNCFFGSIVTEKREGGSLA